MANHIEDDSGLLKWFLVFLASVAVALAAWRRKMHPHATGKSLGSDPTQVVVVPQRTREERSAPEKFEAKEGKESPSDAPSKMEHDASTKPAPAPQHTPSKESTASSKSGLSTKEGEAKKKAETHKAAPKTKNDTPASAAKTAIPKSGSAVASGFLQNCAKSKDTQKKKQETIPQPTKHIEPAKESSNASQGLSDQDTDPPQDAEAWKALGNKAVTAGDHAGAVEHYTHGIELDTRHAILYCNRALCLHKLGRLEEALRDSKICIELRPDFAKAFIRAGKVLKELGRPIEALELLKKAPNHPEVGNLVSEVRPEAEAADEKRISALSGAERCKEQGNTFFKKGLFEQALAEYTEGLEQCTDPTAELTIALRNNRAACYQQISDYRGVVQDTTAVLEIQPDNLKALCRRMVAYEPLEKYQKALDDARAVLRYVPGHEAANKLQHRLGKLVRDLEREAQGDASLGR